METMEHSTEASEETTLNDRRPLIIVLVAIVALLVGAVGGWLLRGSDDGATDDVIEVVTGEPTDRQQEMVRVADDHYAATIAGDGEGLTTLYVPQGILAWHSPGGSNALRADDGSMATMFDNQAAPGRMEMTPPVLVFDDYALRVIDWGPGYGTILHRFTTSGDVLIINSQITNP